LYLLFALFTAAGGSVTVVLFFKNSLLYMAVPSCYYLEGDLISATIPPPVVPFFISSSSSSSKVFGLLTGIGKSSSDCLGGF
jgi:hypothetical protein